MTSLKNIIGKKIVISLYYAFRIFPINRKKIFVSNFFGRGYGDSPKYIIDYLLANYSGYDVVWSVKEDCKFPNGIRIVKNKGYFGIIRNIYEQTTSKIWVDNCRKYIFERKRKGQYYIQTWHGDLGFKKCEGDVIDKIPNKDIENSKHDSKMADLFVCGNEWMYTRYKEAYWYDGEIAVCGLPRRDILYQYNERLAAKLKSNLCIDENFKILLYVPTFRKDDIFNNHLGGYVSQFDWSVTLKTLENRFGGEWLGLMRLHPNAAKYKADLKLPDNVIDVTNYPDIIELFYISDCCISDYSSSLFDFAVTKKPGFIFAPDIVEYEGERGHYFSKKDIPFTVSSDIQELKTNIEKYDEEEYYKRHYHFYFDTIHIYPEGHASEYLSKKIIGISKI